MKKLLIVLVLVLFATPALAGQFTPELNLSKTKLSLKLKLDNTAGNELGMADTRERPNLFGHLSFRLGNAQKGSSLFTPMPILHKTTCKGHECIVEGKVRQLLLTGTVGRGDKVSNDSKEPAPPPPTGGMPENIHFPKRPKTAAEAGKDSKSAEEACTTNECKMQEQKKRQMLLGAEVGRFDKVGDDTEEPSMQPVQKPSSELTSTQLTNRFIEQKKRDMLRASRVGRYDKVDGGNSTQITPVQKRVNLAATHPANRFHEDRKRELLMRGPIGRMPKLDD